MLQDLRKLVKTLPVIGPWLHHAYLTLFYNEGRDETIKSGPLAGLKFRRFMHTFNKQYVDGDYEPLVAKALMTHVQSGQTAYDLGANAGYMTLLMAKLVGPQGKVVAFEPWPITAKQLATQVRINGFTNVIVEPCAISDKVGTAQLFTSTCSVMAKLTDETSGKGLQTVPTTTLNEMVKKYGPPHLMKVDIEGAEMIALRGAADLLEKARPVIVIELHSESISKEFHALMEQARYDVRTPDGQISTPGQYERFVVALPRN